MPERFPLLVFDWDGTLVDSAQAIAEALQGACLDVGLPRPSDERARHIIGLGLKDALRYAVPEAAESDYPRLVERYRVHFLLRDPGTRLFPGVVEGLEALCQAGHLLAIATGKSRRGLERALDQMHLRRFFTASRCGDEGHTKPHPGMLQAVMDELAMPASETLMIGDTTHDLQMAFNAGVRCVGVAYGAHPKPQLMSIEPEACFDSAAELFSWLRENA
ncbi:MAG: HAD-IA family hydrolase [Burkholderiales bacterium]|nr:HAD-IA family hydrolase [Burkholderiales bacterium]